MRSSLRRLALCVLLAGLASSSVYAQQEGAGPYGLDGARIEISPRGWSWGEWRGARGETKPVTAVLTPSSDVGADQITLTVSDGRRTHQLDFRRARDGSFKANAALPSPTAFQSLRFGGSRDEILAPQLRETREGHFTGRRRADGWDITIYVGDDGVEIEINW